MRFPPALWSLSLSLAAASCQCINPPNVSYGCEDAGVCFDPNFVCQGGYCLPPDAGADAGSGTDAGDGGADAGLRDGGSFDGGASDGGLPDGGPCGGSNQTCCPSTPSCQLGLGCDGNNTCVSCGASGQICCGGLCAGRVNCAAGRCTQACGMTLQPCCNVGPACDTNLTCNALNACG